MSLVVAPPCQSVCTKPGAQALTCSASAKRWTLVAAILGSSMAFIDGTVVNVALPSMQRELDASAADLQWVVEAYALFLSALLLVGGALGDRFGRRRVFMLGAALFTMASLGCGLSGTMSELIAMRAVQGIGAALLVPGSLSLLTTVYSPDERGAAIGTWSAFSGITTAIGPVLGGYLVDHYSWTWAFFLNLPIGLVLLFICLRKVPESPASSTRGRLDVLGAASVVLGLGGVVFALIEAQIRGWSSGTVIGSALVGVCCLAAFVRVELKAEAPMLPLALFRDRKFAGANLLTLLLYSAIGGGMFFVPLNLIQVQGFSATAAGAALLPLVIVIFALSRWSGTLADTYGPRLPLMAGPCVAAAGFLLFAIPSVNANYWTTFFPAAITLGLGITITVAPLTATAMNALSSELAGTASGVNNAVARTAGLLAVAAFGLVMATTFDADLPRRLREAQVPERAVGQIEGQREKLAGLVLPEGLTPQARSDASRAVRRSFVGGFQTVMLICAGLALSGSAVAAWTIGGKRRSPGTAPDVPAS